MKRVLFVTFILTMIFAQGCTLDETRSDSSGGDSKFSLLNEFNGLQWGDSLDDVCTALDNANIKYEVIEPKEDEVFTSLHILDNSDFNGLKVEKVIHFRIISRKDPVIVNISYAFESFDDVYLFLQQRIGEPNKIDENNALRAVWSLSKVSDNFSCNEIENIYKLLEFDTSDALSDATAENLMLYEVNGQGYLVNDGSVTASIIEKLR